MQERLSDARFGGVLGGISGVLYVRSLGFYTVFTCGVMRLIIRAVSCGG